MCLLVKVATIVSLPLVVIGHKWSQYHALLVDMSYFFVSGRLHILSKVDKVRKKLINFEGLYARN